MASKRILTYKPVLATLLCIVILTACEMPKQPEVAKETIEMDVFSKPKGTVGLFSAGIEKAHAIPDYRNNKNIQFEMSCVMGEQPPLRATITMSTTSNQTKIENEDGVYFLNADGSSTFAEDTTILDIKRFNYFLWAHFFSLPERLREKDLSVENFDGNKVVNDITYKVRRLDISDEAIKEPFDFYVLYVDKQTDLMRYAGYQMNASLAKLETVTPSAIEFSNYQDVNGIPIAEHWKFWQWSSETGFGNLIGEAKLNNIKFLDVEDGFYTPSMNTNP